MPDWTNAQSNAINARGSNIIVSAAAGSGKTAVLVERVVNLITDEKSDIDIDKLLIVTFTNAAASEMRSRISSRLNEILKENPNNSNAQRQLSLIANAQICTIDSFCINLVRENFFNLDINQDFKIMDESERQLLEADIADEMINELYEQGSEEFLNLVEALSSSKNDSMLSTTIRYLNSFIMSQAFPFEWLDSLPDAYNPDVPIDDAYVRKYVFDELRDYCTLCLELISASEASLVVDDELFEKYSDMLSVDRSAFESVLDAINGGSWDEVKQRVDVLSFGTIPYKRNYTSPSKAVVAPNRDFCKNMANKQMKPLISLTAEEYKEDCERAYPIISLLSGLVKEFHIRVLDSKRELNSYTFGDVEQFAIQLLYEKDDDGRIIRTPLAREYSENYKEILVDEYQDTNSAQDALFEMLSNGRNRFIVGDVKQSIYRFRLAMPYIFNNRKNMSVPYSEDSDDANRRIILDSNFRSRRGICDYTNFVFSHLMSRKVGEMDYTEEEYLNYGAKYTELGIPSAQLMLCDAPEDCDVDEYEAEQIARLINRKIRSGEQVQNGDSTRPIRYGDIAVLFRAPKNRMSVYKEVFSRYGIPSSSNNKTNLFDNNEISILMSLIRVIDNPVQDIPLLSTLMSAFYGFTPDEISLARLEHREGNLYSSISRCDAFKGFVKDIERYREYASSMSVESLIMQIVSETSYLSVISAMGNAEQRRLNVMKLVEIARKFDDGENVGLTAFVRYVDSIISHKLNIEGAELSESEENCVRLMSIHQSKGLEFPVCIFACSAHKYNTEEQRNQLQMDKRLGIGLKIHNEELMYRYNSLQYSVIRDMNDYAAMSENLRVLYVAITRAREQFITFYTRKGITDEVNRLSRKIIDGRIPPSIAKGVLCDGDFLILCALIHKDGAGLRALCDSDIAVDVNTDFDMLISLCNGEAQAEPDVCADVPASEELVRVISDRLSFRYTDSELSGFVSKRTASSLDDGIRSAEFFAKSKPAFLSSGGLTPAERGTAMHSFMQYCDYHSASADLESEISRLCGDNYLTPEQAASLDRQRLSRLFESDFASRMFSSDRIYREIKVSSFVDVSALEDTDSDEKVLVQGIADCVFEEDGELVLVDYKTDRVDSEQELLNRYVNQLSFYKQAVSKTLCKPVKQVMLYSFYLNKICIYK